MERYDCGSLLRGVMDVHGYFRTASSLYYEHGVLKPEMVLSKVFINSTFYIP